MQTHEIKLKARVFTLEEESLITMSLDYFINDQLKNSNHGAKNMLDAQQLLAELTREG